VIKYRGNGVVFGSETGGVARVRTEMHYGRLLLRSGRDATGEALAVGYFDDARVGLETYAEAMAKSYSIKLPPN
jgi:hypothetical protein